MKDSFLNNIKANMTYYESLAGDAKRNNELKLVAKYELLIKLYKGLL